MSERVLKNTFSWSVSRDRCFLECPRQYYYRYYGYWGGWEADADPDLREIYVLKQLKHRPMWIGEVVHDCIKRSLQNLARGIPVLSPDQILKLTRERMRTDFRSSRARRYRSHPKHECGFFEHEYQIDVPDERWLAAAEQVDRCLENFYRSEVYAAFCRLPKEDFLEVEELSKIPLDGVDVIIKLDCAVREPSQIVVWDWKTGRRENPNSQLQMACYAYYASRRYGVPIHHVTTKRFELFSNRVHEDTLSGRAVDDILGYIRGSIEDMQSLLDDPAANTASAERFARVSTREACSRCNFLRACNPPVSGLPHNKE